MSSRNQDIEEIYTNVINDLKEKTLAKLENYDWVERMRLRCRAFIENNGTKIISVEEICDNLAYEAIESFPENLKSELIHDLEVTNANLFAAVLPGSENLDD